MAVSERTEKPARPGRESCLVAGLAPTLADEITAAKTTIILQFLGRKGSISPFYLQVSEPGVRPDIMRADLRHYCLVPFPVFLIAIVARLHKAQSLALIVLDKRQGS